MRLRAGGGKSPASKDLHLAPGLIAKYNASAGSVRPVPNNYQFMQLLQILLHGYVLVGKHTEVPRQRWCSMKVVHEYLVYVRLRVCPLIGQWPPLAKCIQSDQFTRSLWNAKIREGLTMDEAIIASRPEQYGFWCWAAEFIANHAKLSMNYVCDGGGGQETSSSDGPMVGAGAGVDPDAKRQRRGSRSDQTPNVPASRTASGRDICLDWHLGKCTEGNRCGKGRLHICNFVDEKGVLCGMMGKKRSSHPHR
jgi:hypothetical protein